MRRIALTSLLGASLLACQGAAVDTPPSDTGPAETAAGDAGCATSADNLVVNGSFESWTGAEPTGWSGVVEPTTPFDCATAARVTMRATEGIHQDVDLPAPLGPGAQLEITAAVRWASGRIEGPIFDLDFEGADGGTLGPIRSAVPAGFKADGAWHVVTARLAAPEGATWMRIFLDSRAESAQQLDFDQVVVRVTK